MAVPSSSEPEKAGSRRKQRTATATPAPSRLRTVRTQRGYTQAELGKLAGMHRNSIRKLENGTTREVTAENANALAAVLKTSISDLGLRVRATTEARSIRIRRLTPEQRLIVDELLSLPPEDYVLIRGAIDKLRMKRTNNRSRSIRR